MGAAEEPARVASRLLSGYLCGTHSGLPGLSDSGRRLGARRAAVVSSMHRRITSLQAVGEQCDLGRTPWEPEERGALAEALHSTLTHPAVLDLVFFGSQARGGRTGFSDVDAILVIADDVADSADGLRALRPRVLAAQRAVLAHQPMQHHPFEVVTPRLLRRAAEALALPAVALSETCSLNGAAIPAWFADTNRNRSAVAGLTSSLRSVPSWPAHPWEAHRNVAMFELVPTLYLQARGELVPKWRSFEVARAEFDSDWWPYELLDEVRRVWPRSRHRLLDRGADLLRNPWAAVAAWRRLPIQLPAQVRPLLTPSLLRGLHSLADSMAVRAR
jgi:hypothetical protein